MDTLKLFLLFFRLKRSFRWLVTDQGAETPKICRNLFPKIKLRFWRTTIRFYYFRAEISPTIFYRPTCRLTESKSTKLFATKRNLEIATNSTVIWIRCWKGKKTFSISSSSSVRREFKAQKITFWKVKKIANKPSSLLSVKRLRLKWRKLESKSQQFANSLTLHLWLKLSRTFSELICEKLNFKYNSLRRKTK